MKLLLKIVTLLALIAFAIPSHAQTVTTPVVSPATSDSSLQGLAEWLGTQQAQVGTSLSLGTGHVKYVDTWWDAVSYGTKGFNVAAAGSLDLVDLGAGTALANGASTRYGAFLPLHAANVWNQVAAHEGSNWKLASVPNATVFVNALYPKDGQIKHWTWKNDFQVGAAYRFGGS